MKRILIIGANGFTGRRILNDLSVQSYFQTIGCSLREDIGTNCVINYEFRRTDIRNDDAVKELFKQYRPDIVINTSALSVPDYCETHREEAFLTNVKAVGQLARICENYGSRFIHLSTDFVFEGNVKHLYQETEVPNPVNYYGITKWKSEQEVSQNCSNYAIVRVAIVYGETMPGQHGNIFQLVANRLRKREEIRVVSDQWRTPTFVGDVSKGIELLMNNSQNGIFHIAGKECLTISDIAFRVADFLKLDSSLIHPVTTDEMQETTPRPRFSGLCIDKAQRLLGYQPHSIEEGMQEMFESLENKTERLAIT